MFRECADILGLGPRPYTFSYAELRAATEDFNPSNKLGEGGYGPVYKVKFVLHQYHVLEVMTRERRESERRK